MCRTVDYRSRDDNYTFVPHEKECGRCDVMFTERSLKIQIRIYKIHSSISTLVNRFTVRFILIWNGEVHDT